MPCGRGLAFLAGFSRRPTHLGRSERGCSSTRPSLASARVAISAEKASTRFEIRRPQGHRDSV